MTPSQSFSQHAGYHLNTGNSCKNNWKSWRRTGSLLFHAVTEATDWVSPSVLVNKPGKEKLRICIDPGVLNRAIQREHYQIRTPVEILGSLAGAKYFKTLDAMHFRVPTTETRRTKQLPGHNIATPFGRYRYPRLPFGICSAPEVSPRLSQTYQECIPTLMIYRSRDPQRRSMIHASVQSLTGADRLT